MRSQLTRGLQELASEGARHSDDFQIRVMRSKIDDCLDPLPLRHHQVRDYQVDVVEAYGLEHLISVGSHLDGIAGAGEDAMQYVTNGRIVIGYDNRRFPREPPQHFAHFAREFISIEWLLHIRPVLDEH